MTITYTTEELEEALTETYKMAAIVYPLGQDVTFFGSELECYKLAFKMKKMGEIKIGVSSDDRGTHYVSFREWFDIETSQNIH